MGLSDLQEKLILFFLKAVMMTQKHFWLFSGTLHLCLYVSQLWGHAGQIIMYPDVINVFISQQSRVSVKES